ncbi:MAG TPA: matrixin family metalloprotease, partial [Methanocorpusculum sp.]|nr:matrixin family metalloprotease [Methanocorpusculum sp.]
RLPIYSIDNNAFLLDGFDPLRKQCDATKILNKLDIFRQKHPKLFKPDNIDNNTYYKYHYVYEKVLLVTHTDIYEQLSDFVFGLASQSLGVATISIFRLNNEYYNYNPNYSDLIDRVVKISTHEIGHLFGLGHCDHSDCIMYCSHSIGELDSIHKQFCDECRAQLDLNLKNNYQM